MRASVRRLKTQINSEQGKRSLLLATARRIMEELRRESCIRGHHICNEIWDPAIGGAVQCGTEPRNAIDRYSVSLIKEGFVAESLPRRMFRLCSLFFAKKRGGY